VIIGFALRLRANCLFFDINTLSIEVPQMMLLFLEIISRSYVMKLFLCVIDCFDWIFFIVITTVTGSVATNVAGFSFGLFAGF
jgi:hypothetical protein